MIVIAAIIVGALLGYWRARKIGAGRRDLVHYAAAHALMFAIAGLLATVVADRMLRG